MEAKTPERLARPKLTKRQAESLQAYVKLYRAAASITGNLAAVLAEHDLTMTQYNVLDTLLHIGSVQQRDLGGKAMKSDGNITFVLVNLEKMGLVERTRTERMKRDLTVSLTATGYRKIASVFPVFASTVAERMRVLGSDEIEELGALCKRVGLGLKHAD